MKDGNEKILSAQSADTMTHPGYRFKGLFVELSNLCFGLCRDEGIRLIFGFPNQNSLHGAIHKLGWQMTDTMDCFIVPVKAPLVQNIIRKLPLFRKAYQWYSKFVLKKYLFDRPVENSIIQQGYIGVCRDPDFWEYKKYYQREVLRIGDSLVWVRLSNEALVIGDINLADDFDTVMNILLLITARLGISQVQFHASTATAFHGMFIEKWKPVPSFPVLFQDFDSGLQLDKIKFNFGDIDIF